MVSNEQIHKRKKISTWIKSAKKETIDILRLTLRAFQKFLKLP